MNTLKVFIIGSTRSGSNLLRVMLGQLPNIAIPHPPHIIHRLMPLVPSYGDLNLTQNFTSLIEDACRLVELNFVQWEMKLDQKEIFQRCRQPNLIEITVAIYDSYAERYRKAGWVNKSNYNVHYALEIERIFPDAKFIYLYRDGRDVALSNLKGIVGEKHYYFMANDWHTTQQKALKFKLSSANCHPLRYEDLVIQPEETCQALCQFLGVTYTVQMMEFYHSQEAQQSASSSQVMGNIVKPVMKDNVQKFLKSTSYEDLRIFESVAGASLDALGYKRIAVQPKEELQFSEGNIQKFEIENNRLKEAAWTEWSGADREARQKLGTYLAEIAERNASGEEVLEQLKKNAMGTLLNIK